jgi:hypothetical protein
MVDWKEKSIKQKQMEITRVFSKHIFTIYLKIETVLGLFT